MPILDCTAMAKALLVRFGRELHWRRWWPRLGLSSALRELSSTLWLQPRPERTLALAQGPLVRVLLLLLPPSVAP